MAINKKRAEIAEALSKAKDWKQLAIEAREKKQKKKKKEMEDMINAMKGK